MVWTFALPDWLFDHQIGAQLERWRESDSELLGSLKIDRELKPGRLHDRQVGRLLAFESAVELEAGLAIRFRTDIA
jgi:hypothetical protein